MLFRSTFSTGGSPEIIDEKTGSVVTCDDVDEMIRMILDIYDRKPFKKVDCIELAKIFDLNDKFFEYVQLYEGN